MTLRIGVIGTGAIGQEHIARLHGKLVGSTVTAVSDINADGARAVAERLCPGAAVHATGQGVIDDPNVDAIVVTSWGPAHAESVLGAIAAGKPVFCEKPLATTAADCLKIVDAEIASGRHLVQVGFMRRYDAGYRLLKKTVTSGEIGEPLILHCAHRNPDVPDNYLGDMGLTDTFVHEIDVLRWLVNDDYVSAQVIDAKPTRHARNGLQDPCMVILRTKSGIVIDTEIFVNCQFGYDIQCQVVGEDGTANLPEPATVPLRKASMSGKPILMDWKLRFIDSYDVELQEWIDSTVAGRVDGPTAWDGYFASVTADACVEARRTGQVVPITVRDKPPFYA